MAHERKKSVGHVQTITLEIYDTGNDGRRYTLKHHHRGMEQSVYSPFSQIGALCAIRNLLNGFQPFSCELYHREEDELPASFFRVDPRKLKPLD